MNGSLSGFISMQSKFTKIYYKNMNLTKIIHKNDSRVQVFLGDWTVLSIGKSQTDH